MRFIFQLILQNSGGVNWRHRMWIAQNAVRTSLTQPKTIFTLQAFFSQREKILANFWQVWTHLMLFDKTSQILFFSVWILQWKSWISSWSWYFRCKKNARKGEFFFARVGTWADQRINSLTLLHWKSVQNKRTVQSEGQKTSSQFGGTYLKFLVLWRQKTRTGTPKSAWCVLSVKAFLPHRKVQSPVIKAQCSKTHRNFFRTFKSWGGKEISRKKANKNKSSSRSKTLEHSAKKTALQLDAEKRENKKKRTKTERVVDFSKLSENDGPPVRDVATFKHASAIKLNFDACLEKNTCTVMQNTDFSFSWCCALFLEHESRSDQLWGDSTVTFGRKREARF